MDTIKKGAHFEYDDGVWRFRISAASMQTWVSIPALAKRLRRAEENTARQFDGLSEFDGEKWVYLAPAMSMLAQTGRRDVPRLLRELENWAWLARWDALQLLMEEQRASFIAAAKVAVSESLTESNAAMAECTAALRQARGAIEERNEMIATLGRAIRKQKRTIRQLARWARPLTQ